LVAAIVHPKDSYSEWIGLENHLNYVYRNGADLTQAEAMGLSAYFNSALVDRYFRAISGNTQVNATEIRTMPMPDAKTIIRIGIETELESVRDPNKIERIVGRCLRLPDLLLERLCQEAQ
jgi:adenine-specific DNA-methyltransferase